MPEVMVKFQPVLSLRATSEFLTKEQQGSLLLVTHITTRSMKISLVWAIAMGPCRCSVAVENWFYLLLAGVLWRAGLTSH